MNKSGMRNPDLIRALESVTEERGIVEKGFVKTFFKLVDYDTSSDEPTVDLEDVTRWMEIDRKDILMRILKNKNNGFIQGVDFIESKGRGSVNLKKTMMTRDCFKLLCMLAPSKVGHRLRRYYVAVEVALIDILNALIREKNDIIKDLKIKIVSKETLKAMQGKAHGVIYILPAHLAHKLGKTNNLIRRLREHNASKSKTTLPIFVWKTENMHSVETCAKAMLSAFQQQRGREIYTAKLDMMQAVVIGCDALNSLTSSKSTGTRALLKDLVDLIHADQKVLIHEASEWHMVFDDESNEL